MAVWALWAKTKKILIGSQMFNVKSFGPTLMRKDSNLQPNAVEALTVGRQSVMWRGIVLPFLIGMAVSIATLGYFDLQWRTSHYHTAESRKRWAFFSRMRFILDFAHYHLDFDVPESGISNVYKFFREIEKNDSAVWVLDPDYWSLVRPRMRDDEGWIVDSFGRPLVYRSEHMQATAAKGQRFRLKLYSMGPNGRDENLGGDDFGIEFILPSPPAGVTWHYRN